MKKFLAFILVLCTVFSLAGCGGNSYKDAVIDYLEVYRAGKIEKLENLAPKKVINQLEEENTFDITTRQNDIEEHYNGLLKSLVPLYGEDYKFSVEVSFKEELSENKLKAIKEKLNSRYNIKKEDVKEIAEAEFTMTHSGSKKEKSIESNVLIVKIDGNWYVCNENGDFGITNNMLNY